MNVVILGPPGSGKGTQSKMISVFNSNLVVIDCGKLLRSINLDSNVRNQMNRGNLLDDSIVISVIREKIKSVVSSGMGFVLDGFPRSVKQCEALFEILDGLDIGLSCVIKLSLDDSIAIDRLERRIICKSCGELFNIEKQQCDYCGSREHVKREDDFDSEFIKKRLSSYRQMEGNIVKFFKDTETKILSIDASKAADAVTADIRAQLLIFS